MDYIRKIRTADGDKQIDYTALANLPIRKVATIELLASAWQGAQSPYSQVVTLTGITPTTQVDLTPDVEQLVIFHDKDLAFVTENDNGTVTVYAIGDKPTNNYTMQVTLTEVTV